MQNATEDVNNHSRTGYPLNNNASQLAVQSATVEILVSTEFEFILGLMLGLKRG
jgi:hypothetical protein